MKTIKEQFTRYDAEELHPECNNSEYLEYKEVISGLGSAICSYGFKVIDEKEGQKEYKYFWAKKTDICAYCGEYKWENKEKHIAEIATFLQQKIRELQEILSFNQKGHNKVAWKIDKFLTKYKKEATLLQQPNEH